MTEITSMLAAKLVDWSEKLEDQYIRTNYPQGTTISVAHDGRYILTMHNFFSKYCWRKERKKKKQTLTFWAFLKLSVNWKYSIRFLKKNVLVFLRDCFNKRADLFLSLIQKHKIKSTKTAIRRTRNLIKIWKPKNTFVGSGNHHLKRCCLRREIEILKETLTKGNFFIMLLVQTVTLSI